jgi:hypothetical protein
MPETCPICRTAHELPKGFKQKNCGTVLGTNKRGEPELCIYTFYEITNVTVKKIKVKKKPKF